MMLLRLALFGLVLSAPVDAAIEAMTFDDPEREQTYQRLIEELRCLVCQNQNLAESNAGLADDLRKEVYQMLQEGRSRKEVIDFLVSRYGDFVLYEPPIKSETFLLWAGPAFMLLIGGGIVIWAIRQRRNEPLPAADDETRQQAHALLHGQDPKREPRA